MMLEKWKTVKPEHRPSQKIIKLLLVMILVVLVTGCNLPSTNDGVEEFTTPDVISEETPTVSESSQVTITEEPFSMGPLYRIPSEYKYIHPGYSEGEDSGAPWGFGHLGLDLIITPGGADVLAPADGVVEVVDIYNNPRNNQWQVNIHIRSGSKFAYHILFEPRAPSEGEIAVQREAIPLSVGQEVHQGDLLGRMLDLSHGDRNGGEPGIHFDLFMDDAVICPEPYFEPDALAGMLSLVQAMYPGAKLCYP